jgi:membrane-associated phospholipid phosphatase
MYKRLLLILYVGVMFDASARYPYGRQCAEWFQEFFCLISIFFRPMRCAFFSGFAPLYIAARFFDHHIHRYMYESSHHANKQPAPAYVEWLCDEWGELIPLIGLSSFAFVHKHMYLRTVSRIYIFGAITTSLINKLCKHMLEREWTRRPLNGDFPKRYVHGGFPSGHAAILN